MRESSDDAAALRASGTGVYHGGNLEAARRLFPNAPLPWIDLSTGINPCPYPVQPLTAESWMRLPGAGAIRGLEAAAAGFFGAKDAAHVVAAPGTQGIIQTLPQGLASHRGAPVGSVGILGFTYQEHQAVWQQSGVNPVETVDHLEALARFDVAVVVNPNNPDGRLVPAGALVDLAATLQAKGGMLIVDEAFMDLMAPGCSLIPHLPLPNVIVLRSFGKTWGLAGLRLGFVAAEPGLAAAFRARFGPWAVSGPAIEIGARAYADRQWLWETAGRLTQAASHLDALLVAAGFTIVGGTSLYRLAAHSDARGWFDRLGRAGILTRPFPVRPDWLRFGMTGDQPSFDRLRMALAADAAPCVRC